MGIFLILPLPLLAVTRTRTNRAETKLDYVRLTRIEWRSRGKFQNVIVPKSIERERNNECVYTQRFVVLAKTKKKKLWYVVDITFEKNPCDRERYTLGKNTKKPKWVLVTVFFFFYFVLTGSESIILRITPKTRRVARPYFRVIIVVAMFPYVFIIDQSKVRYE